MNPFDFLKESEYFFESFTSFDCTYYDYRKPLENGDTLIVTIRVPLTLEQELSVYTSEPCDEPWWVRLIEAAKEKEKTLYRLRRLTS